MNSLVRWQQAQRAESEFWSGIATADQEILRVMESSCRRAARVQEWIGDAPKVCLEVGVGGLGVGVIGFLPALPVRIGIDPLPLVRLRCGEAVRSFVNSLRCRAVVGSGESLPVRDQSVDLVVCCNVLDHVRDAAAVLAEIRRVLRPGAALFLEVDTFSLCSLVKWHCWTKHLRAAETLVRAHPYRFLESAVLALLERHGMEVLHHTGHTRWSAVFGKSRPSVFFAVRR